MMDESKASLALVMENSEVLGVTDRDNVIEFLLLGKVLNPDAYRLLLGALLAALEDEAKSDDKKTGASS